MIIVSDTSPVANLILIGELLLLQKLFTEVVIPPAVDKEILALQSLNVDISVYKNSKWIKIIKPASRENVDKLIGKLDIGEAEAIVLAEELDADYLLIDERLGTGEANKRMIKTLGLLAVLIMAKQRSFINEIKPLITTLKQQGFWMSDKLIAKVLDAAGES